MINQNIISSITEKKNENIKKMKEDYKKLIKDKNYSRSIDTAIPKQKLSGNNIQELQKIKVNNIKIAKK